MNAQKYEYKSCANKVSGAIYEYFCRIARVRSTEQSVAFYILKREGVSYDRFLH